MKIKKHRSMRRGYWEYLFVSEPEDLSNDVIETCRILKKGNLIVELFSKDPLNDILLSNGRRIYRNGNFSYHLCDDVTVFRTINFADTRYFCIYSVLQFDDCQVNRRYLNDNYTFCICFENYLDTSQLVVCAKYYSDSIATVLYSGE